MRKHMMPAVSMAALQAMRPEAVFGPVKNDAGGAEEMLKTVKNELERLNGEVKQTAETALAEAKKSGEVSAETKDTADRLLATQTVMDNTVKGLEDIVNGLDAKIQDMAQEVAASGKKGASSPVSLGSAVVDQGEEKIKAFIANGFAGNALIKVENAITTGAGSAGGLIYHDEDRAPVNMARRKLRILDLLPRGTASSDLITYRKQVLRTDNAAPVAEGAAAPASEYGWDKVQVPVRKLAHVTHISEEALADADQLQTELNTEMRYGLDREVEEQIVAGDGTGENLDGLIPNATAFAAAVGLPNTTRIDRLRLAILQITLNDYMADVLLLNPTDWAAIDLLKVAGADNRYVHGNPGAATTPMLWGKDVVESNSMTINEWLVGDLEMAATFHQRAEAEVLISSEHDQNFVEGMLTMKASLRAALAVRRQGALVAGDFTFA